MAKVIYGNIIVDMRGSINGNTYSKNAAGNFSRARVVGTNPNTVKQTQERGQLGALSSAWRGLTQAQRDTWIQGKGAFPYTDSLGQTKTYTAQQLFVKLNKSIRSDNPSAALITSIPNPVAVSTYFATAAAFTLTASVLTTATITPNVATLATNEKVIVFATRGLSAGVGRPPQSAFRKLGSYSAAASLNILTNYLAVFGSPAITTRVFVSVQVVNTVTGQRGAIAKQSAIVA